MPNEHGPQRGDIIYVKIHGKITTCCVIDGMDSLGLCLAKVESTGDIISVSRSQIITNISEVAEKGYQLNQNVQVWIKEETHDIYKEVIEQCECAFSELSDEYLESIAPPESDNSLTAEQDEYRMMYNATCSVGSILITLLRCATSNNRISDTELLALRDKAEEFGNMDIVYAIDSHFEEEDD